jgi:(2S)-methylsuccinyl-CoA dehydrogenase
MMAVEIMIARQLTYFSAARRTPAGAAISRPAWPSCSAPASPGPAPTMRCRSMAATASRWNTDLSRVLCDARILNIFEGAAEIQAQVIARRLL